MSFNALNGASNLAGLIPDPIVGQIIEGIKKQSLVARSFRTIPVSAGVNRLPVMDALPIAQWQNPAESAPGQSSEVKWKNVYLNIETLQVLVPVSNSTLEDAQFDVWSAVMPSITEACAMKLDQAALFGTYAPASFPTSIYAQAVANSATVTAGTTAANGGIAEDFNKADEKVNLSGYNTTHILAGSALANKIRRGRDANGQRYADLSVSAYEELPILYGANSGLFPSGSGQPMAIFLDSSQYTLGIRRDITINVMTEGVITDSDGKVVYNAGTMDGKILVVNLRWGWACANAVTVDNQFGGTNEVVTLTQASVTSGATFTVTFGGKTTVALDREATAADVQTAMENLASIGKDNILVTRSGSAGARVYTLTFVNQLGSKDVSAVTAAVTDGTITPAVVTAGAVGARNPAAVLVSA